MEKVDSKGVEVDSGENLLVMDNIVKTFPGVTALKGVSITVKKGEILGLVGENGAGKSTLLKILYGLLQPDRGRILWEGKEVRFRDPFHAMMSGIFYVPQEILISPNLSVAETLFLGFQVKKLTEKISYNDLYEKSRNILKIVRLENVDPRTRIGDLPPAVQQLVLIARALASNAKLIILDEPTGTLTPYEVERLLEVMRNLKSKGISLIFVSHRIEEVLSVADRIIVLRDGEKVGEYDNTTRKVTLGEIVKAMIAREIKDFYPKEPVEIGDVVIEVKGLTGHGVKDISFSVRRGEIFGIFGLIGSGALEIGRLLGGVYTPQEGEIYIEGKRCEIRNPKDAIKNGIIYIPEERRAMGLIPLMNVTENMGISGLDLLTKLKLGLLSVIDKTRELEVTKSLIKRLDIKPPDPRRKVMYLSGGNQQKVLVGRAFIRPSKVIVFSEATRGIDVGAKVEVRRFMVQLAKEGKAIIFISSDVHEVIGMSDRIMVVVKGRIAGIFDRKEATPELIMNIVASSKHINFTEK